MRKKFLGLFQICQSWHNPKIYTFLSIFLNPLSFPISLRILFFSFYISACLLFPFFFISKSCFVCFFFVFTSFFVYYIIHHFFLFWISLIFLHFLISFHPDLCIFTLCIKKKFSSFYIYGITNSFRSYFSDLDFVFTSALSKSLLVFN